MEISKVDVKYLKEKYGTPLYIYDVAHLKRNMEGYLKYFKSNEFETEVLFASKAFSVKEALRIAKEEGMSLDVVSLGELYTALKVDFPKNKIYFHGNNKTIEELEYAISIGIGIIVVDNLMELYAIDEITKKLSKGVNILIRMNVGVEAHTHKFIVTSHVDSKFGVL
jgi:diaminopimelate decarboxylase